jgi:hypothetical protein
MPTGVGLPADSESTYVPAPNRTDTTSYNIEAAPSDSTNRSRSGRPGGVIGIEGQEALPKPEDEPRRAHGRAGAAGLGLFRRRIHGRAQTGVDAEPILPPSALLAAESAAVRE